MIQPPELIAHRGHMRDYPENTLAALRYALRSGARQIEFDVQLTRDHVPVLFHDEALLRTTGRQGLVTEIEYTEARRTSAHYPERFGERFAHEPIPSLRDAVALLNESRGVIAFVEIKRHSLERFGVETCLGALAAALESASFHWVLISFEIEAVRRARSLLHRPIGWVLREYDEPSHARALELSPDYLFCNVLRLPDTDADLWTGPWRWVIYDIEEPELALKLARRGAQCIETGQIDTLVAGLASR